MVAVQTYSEISKIAEQEIEQNKNLQQLDYTQKKNRIERTTLAKLEKQIDDLFAENLKGNLDNQDLITSITNIKNCLGHFQPQVFSLIIDDQRSRANSNWAAVAGKEFKAQVQKVEQMWLTLHLLAEMKKGQTTGINLNSVSATALK